MICKRQVGQIVNWEEKEKKNIWMLIRHKHLLQIEKNTSPPPVIFYTIIFFHLQGKPLFHRSKNPLSPINITRRVIGIHTQVK